MMNVIAITIVATSLAVAGVFSPTPAKDNNEEQQVIVKEGHRAVVVEYADTPDAGNTKVSISSKAGSIENQLSRAAASVAGVAQEAKGKAQEVLSTHEGFHGATPRELICDAYGKCKHRIAGALSRVKEKAAEAEEEVKEIVGGAVDKAKDLASKATYKAEECTEGVRGNVQEMVSEVGESAERAKERTGEMVRETGEMAREKVEKVKGKTGEVVEETAEKIKEKGRKGKKELSDIAKRGKEVVFDVMRFIFWPESLGSLVGMIHILGCAMAYGMSVWVTFIMSHVLAGVLPREQFGMVQSKIYPVYFKAMVGSVGLALLGHLLGQRSMVLKNKADMLQAYNLMGSMLAILTNLLFLEPKASKVMFERMKLEKEEGRGRGRTVTRTIDTVVTDAAGPVPATSTAPSVEATPRPPRPDQDDTSSKLAELHDRLKKLNSYSSLLNIMTLMGLTWHLVYLNQRLGVNRC